MFSPSVIPIRQALEFCVQQPSLKCVQSAVVAFNVVVILLGLAMVAQHADFLCEAGIVGGHRASFAAGPQVLSRIEAEGCRAAHRSGLHPAILLARKIFGSVSLAGVLDYEETEPLRQFLNRIHVDGLSVEVDRNDGCDWPAAATAD